MTHSHSNETGKDEVSVEHITLLSAVTGLGSEPQLTPEEFAEADRLIADPDIPCSDLRGKRDMPEYANEHWRQEIG